MLKDVIEARVVGLYRLYLRFEDGASGEVDLRELVEFRGVFQSLQDPNEVAKVVVDPERGTVCWPSGADLDPDVLYATVARFRSFDVSS